MCIRDRPPTAAGTSPAERWRWSRVIGRVLIDPDGFVRWSCMPGTAFRGPSDGASRRAVPLWCTATQDLEGTDGRPRRCPTTGIADPRPEALSLIHISEPTRLLSISYAV